MHAKQTLNNAPTKKKLILDLLPVDVDELVPVFRHDAAVSSQPGSIGRATLLI